MHERYQKILNLFAVSRGQNFIVSRCGHTETVRKRTAFRQSAYGLSLVFWAGASVPDCTYFDTVPYRFRFSIPWLRADRATVH